MCVPMFITYCLQVYEKMIFFHPKYFQYLTKRKKNSLHEGGKEITCFETIIIYMEHKLAYPHDKKGILAKTMRNLL